MRSVTEPRVIAACVASSHVHLVFEDGGSEPVESKFALDVRRRSAENQRRGDWKKSGSGASFMGAGMRWADDPVEEVITATGVARGRKRGEILYTLRTSAVGGLFAYDLATREETRVYHGTNTDFHGLTSSDIHAVLATATAQGNLRRSIAVLRDDGGELAVVTEGDSLDDDPSWVPTPAVGNTCVYELVYSSAGVGRDQAGQLAGLGPRTIVLLDAQHGKMKTLVEDAKFDFVNPRMTADGTLYAIRRPYVAPHERGKPSLALKDAALLPMRLGNAVFSYLDFFSTRYSGKPLRSTGSAQDRAADARRMLELGNLARGVRSMERGIAEPPPEARVPSDWELVTLEPKGAPRVIADRVASFDLGPGGDIVSTDGESLYRLDASRAHRPRKLGELPFITDLAAL